MRISCRNGNFLLLRQGETEDLVYFILKGRVVVKREENGRYRITRSVGPGGLSATRSVSPMPPFRVLTRGTTPDEGSRDRVPLPLAGED